MTERKHFVLKEPNKKVTLSLSKHDTLDYERNNDNKRHPKKYQGVCY